MDVIVDRIEGDYAVVEIDKGKMCNLPLELVPNIKEGDVVTITINKDKTWRYENPFHHQKHWYNKVPKNSKSRNRPHH